MDEFAGDERFAHIPKDPKFRRIPKSERKVKIDKRFQSMFKDKKFKVTYTIDKRGRPVQKSSAEDLEKYYELSSDSEDDVEKTESVESPAKVEEKKKSKKPSKKTVKEVKESAPSEDESDELDETTTNKDSLEENERQLTLGTKKEKKTLSNEVKRRLRDLTVDYARGEGLLLSDSSSDDASSEDSEEEDDEDEGIDHMWGELDKEADTTDEVTSRLAACNMDWDRIRAVDLMVLFNSFLPPGGLIHSVTIYPSEFGLERMREEEMKGPIELAELKDNENTSDDGAEDENAEADDDEEGNEFRREKLRQYQLNRLKYYYAVIEFDSPASANKVYTECDNHEYESTATKLDLRFIPDDMTFDQEPKEVCDKLPDMSKYQPRQFTTTALQQVKVECTWDETKLDRQEITKRINTGKVDDIDENDLKAYLASGSSDDESEGEEQKERNGDDGDEKDNDPIAKYKSLLKSIEQQEEEKKKKDGELEFTWGLGTKEKAEKLVSEKMKKAEMLTPFEQFLDKRKEKKKAKREANKKKASESAEQDNQSNSDSEDSIPSDVDMDDPYFAEEFKKSKPKDKKKKDRRDESDDDAQGRAELELLMLDKEDEQQKNHFDMKKIEEGQLLSKSKKKRLSKKKKDQKATAAEDEFEVNVKDPRFNALFTSHHFNIDPADTHYRKTKGTEALIQEKLKRRANNDDISEELPAKQSKKDKEPQMNADLAALVKSVKRNTKNISQRIK